MKPLSQPLLLGVVCIIMMGQPVRAADPAPVETKEQRDARMAWWREAQFGMFIHWGVYSVPAGEWKGKTGYGEWFLEETKIPVSQYEKFARDFNPVKFDAKAWVKIAKAAGMKYIVITSKHHDGFDMYPSELGDWGIKSTPFGRDPLMELSEACKAAGIRFCIYYSIMDWHHADWGTRRAWNDIAVGKPDMDRYTTYMKGQLKEIITRYHPGLIWFDGEWESPWTHERAVDLNAYLRALDPNIIINNRIDKQREGMAGMSKGDSVGDYGTPEQQIPAAGFGPGVYWESCMTLNDHWGYNKHDQHWKSPETVIHNLADIASKGGNYLLNVGPTSEGVIPEGSQRCLAEVAKWMAVNGDALHGTSAGPFKKAFAWGRCTSKPGKLYLHVFEWPKDATLNVPISNVVTKAYLLAEPDKALAVQSGADGATITLPASAPDAIDSVLALEIDGAATAIVKAPTQAEDGSIALLATDAEIVGTAAKLQEDNIGYWVNPSDFVQWTVRVNKPGTFNVELNYSLLSAGPESAVAVAAGDQTLAAKLAPTGGWDDYKIVSLGTLTINVAGNTTVTVKATAKGGDGVMNLRRLVLKPVK